MSNNRDEPVSTDPFCSFLGLEDDPQTALAFASIWNNCHRCKPVEAVNLDHQGKYCLSPRFATCPVYSQAPDQALPEAYALPQSAKFNNQKKRNSMVLVLMALLILGSIIGFTLYGLPLRIYSPENIASPTLQPKMTPSSTPTLQTAEFNATTSPTQLPITLSLTEMIVFPDLPTPALTRTVHQIESLIGLNYLFRIHRTSRDEKISTLAFENGTTVEAILTLNYSISTPLKAQQLVVIPVNRRDISDLPKFEAYRVLEDIHIEVLAKQLGVEPSELQLYNGLGSYTQLFKGEWLVVPREVEPEE